MLLSIVEKIQRVEERELSDYLEEEALLLPWLRIVNTLA